MAVKGNGSRTEVVLFAARPICCKFAAKSEICTSRTGFVVETMFLGLPGVEVTPRSCRPCFYPFFHSCEETILCFRTR
jgi:hypothetical protein